ncbi:hypothetical protein BCR36DRAFT_408681 [Piromyces finnis]|uniref:Glycosyltransferase family 17 protein n=1 Tax=Piromyces finnis TaxID=1754191 RepID=A0A1Y1VMN7_9FUNG|nr:hypothetical protein BCR36DRAFT_408681 [Piromyces finnis]|eukprot:ORX59154.1 hypothetical protein BCR36DRAFT_408681 [Piromyces finnis]
MNCHVALINILNLEKIALLIIQLKYSLYNSDITDSFHRKNIKYVNDTVIGNKTVIDEQNNSFKANGVDNEIKLIYNESSNNKNKIPDYKNNKIQENNVEEKKVINVLNEIESEIKIINNNNDNYKYEIPDNKNNKIKENNVEEEKVIDILNEVDNKIKFIHNDNDNNKNNKIKENDIEEEKVIDILNAVNDNGIKSNNKKTQKNKTKNKGNDNKSKNKYNKKKKVKVLSLGRGYVIEQTYTENHIIKKKPLYDRYGVDVNQYIMDGMINKALDNNTDTTIEEWSLYTPPCPNLQPVHYSDDILNPICEDIAIPFNKIKDNTRIPYTLRLSSITSQMKKFKEWKETDGNVPNYKNATIKEMLSETYHPFDYGYYDIKENNDGDYYSKVIKSPMDKVPDPRRRRLFSMILFNSEFELLDVYLSEFYEIVDYFIIYESNCTFSGYKKPLYLTRTLLETNRYEKFRDKIIPVTLPVLEMKKAHPRGPAFPREHLARRQVIEKGLRAVNARHGDLFFHGDLDEMPKARLLSYLKKCGGWEHLQMGFGGAPESMADPNVKSYIRDKSLPIAKSRMGKYLVDYDVFPSLAFNSYFYEYSFNMVINKQIGVIFHPNIAIFDARRSLGQYPQYTPSGNKYNLKKYAKQHHLVKRNEIKTDDIEINDNFYGNNFENNYNKDVIVDKNDIDDTKNEYNISKSNIGNNENRGVGDKKNIDIIEDNTNNNDNNSEEDGNNIYDIKYNKNENNDKYRKDEENKILKDYTDNEKAMGIDPYQGYTYTDNDTPDKNGEGLLGEYLRFATKPRKETKDNQIAFYKSGWHMSSFLPNMPNFINKLKSYSHFNFFRELSYEKQKGIILQRIHKHLYIFGNNSPIPTINVKLPETENEKVPNLYSYKLWKDIQRESKGNRKSRTLKKLNHLILHEMPRQVWENPICYSYMLDRDYGLSKRLWWEVIPKEEWSTVDFNQLNNTVLNEITPFRQNDKKR